VTPRMSAKNAMILSYAVAVFVLNWLDLATIHPVLVTAVAVVVAAEMDHDAEVVVIVVVTIAVAMIDGMIVVAAVRIVIRHRRATVVVVVAIGTSVMRVTRDATVIKHQRCNQTMLMRLILLAVNCER